MFRKNPTPGTILRRTPCTICTDDTPIPLNRADIHAGNLGAVLTFNCLTCGTNNMIRIEGDLYRQLSDMYARIHLQVEEMADPLRTLRKLPGDEQALEVCVGIVVNASNAELRGWITEYRASHDMS